MRKVSKAQVCTFRLILLSFLPRHKIIFHTKAYTKQGSFFSVVQIQRQGWFLITDGGYHCSSDDSFLIISWFSFHTFNTNKLILYYYLHNISTCTQAILQEKQL